MNDRTKPVWLLALLVALLVLVLPASAAAAKSMYYYDFEKTSKPWASAATAGIKVSPLDILRNENGCPSVFDVSHAFVQFQAVPGQPSAAWIVASFPGSGRDMVRLNWSEKGANICPDCKPILYLGSELPSELSQFRGASPSVTDPPPWGDWISYQYPGPSDPDLPVVNNGSIYVAIGMMASPYKEVTSEAFGVDCIDLTIFPGPMGDGGAWQ